MDGQPRSDAVPATDLSSRERIAAAEGRIATVSSLLEALDEPSGNPGTATTFLSAKEENRLVQVRLGIAGSLFAALRGKHEATAHHCLRVALACSAWASKIGLSDSQRDELELAALLHDVGKIGVPDEVLLKAGTLDKHESSLMDAHWQIGRSILRESCGTASMLAVVEYARAWFDGSRHSVDLLGEEIPLGARMLAIVDAFDAMLTDHVYRRALPLERAYHELYSCAGSQFDPSLVLLFIKLFESDQVQMDDAARRWLKELDPEVANAHWRRNEKPHRASSGNAPDDLFQQKLLDTMYDAVVFIDSSSRITLWNRGAERLTGISGHSVYQQMWLPSLLGTRDEQGRLVKDAECPVTLAIRNGVQWLRRLTISGRGGRQIAVDAHAVPVIGGNGITHGLTLLLHDVSPEITLEQRCRSLHEAATKDPLTQVANRAEFDRMHETFVAAHRESNRPCSLIMADIDRFKHVNDTYGHQAGDEAIQSFARLLQNSAGAGDLVARYGGEEFVVLCADCDNMTAARRTEEIRLRFSETRQVALEHRCVTASFGVTEIQPGDTPETMLRRADRALLLAKESGRNRVVQLGGGADSTSQPVAAPQAQHRLRGGQALLAQDLITESPIDRSIEKLRGFIADQHGEILSIDGKHVRIKIGAEGSIFFRRRGEHQARLIMDLKFEEESTSRASDRRGGLTRTRIHVEIYPQRNRERRQADVLARARQLLISFRAYLMAADAAPKVTNEVAAANAANAKPWWAFLPFCGGNAPPVDDR